MEDSQLFNQILCQVNDSLIQRFVWNIQSFKQFLVHWEVAPLPLPPPKLSGVTMISVESFLSTMLFDLFPFIKFEPKTCLRNPNPKKINTIKSVAIYIFLKSPLLSKWLMNYDKTITNRIYDVINFGNNKLPLAFWHRSSCLVSITEKNWTCIYWSYIVLIPIDGCTFLSQFCPFNFELLNFKLFIPLASIKVSDLKPK